MANRVRQHDWSSTVLGPISNWPAALVNAVNLLLSCRFPGMVFWGAEMIQFYNDSFLPLMAEKHPTALGQTAAECWKEAWHIAGPQLSGVLATGEPLYQENVLVPVERGGKLRDVYWIYSYSPIFLPSGEAAGILNVCHDVTGELKARRQLNESEARASRILQSIGDAVIVTDADTRIVLMNPIAEALTRWRFEDAKGRLLPDVFHIINEATRERSENPADKVHRLGAIVGLANHTVLIGKDGTETHIDDSGAPIWNTDGSLSGIVLVFRDINERRATEQERAQMLESLHASESRLRLATETARLGSWEVDLATGHMECSVQCKANYGRPTDAPFPYTELLQVIFPEDLAGMQAAVQNAIKNRTEYKAEYRVVWPDASVRWILVGGRVVYDALGKPHHMTGTSMDVTERHASQEALLRSEKLAAVGRLATTIAHEINNPLESVTNLLYLAKGSKEYDQTQEYLDSAEQELRRVSAIANQTLKFYKQSTSPSDVTCLELFSSVLNIYHGRIVNSGVHVEKRKRANQGIRCFDGEIRQVLSNLIGNAIDAMHPNGGRLILRSREATEWKTGDPGLLLTVADTGTGINPLILRNIFDAFYTTKGTLGTGLGLWVSKEIVERHSGSLRVRSSTAEGKSGTVFSLFLPFDAVIRRSTSNQIA